MRSRLFRIGRYVFPPQLRVSRWSDRALLFGSNSTSPPSLARISIPLPRTILSIPYTMQVNSLLRFGNVCPFIGGATPTTLRALAKTHGVSNMSSLTTRALACPMMGPQLAAIGQARAYASVAANKDIADMHNVSRSIASIAHLAWLRDRR